MNSRAKGIGQTSKVQKVDGERDRYENSIIRDNRVLAGCELQPYFIGKGSLI